MAMTISNKLSDPPNVELRSPKGSSASFSNIHFKEQNDNLIIETNVEAGDVILFNRPCYKMDPFSCFICYGAKASAFTSWDHVGIVVENDKSELFILEANANGVTCRSLIDRIRLSKTKSIAIRKLLGEKPKNMKDQLWNMSQELTGKKYNSSLPTMIAGGISSYAMHGQNKYYQQKMLISTKMNHIKVELQDLQRFPVVYNLLNLRLSQLSKSLQELEDDISITTKQSNQKRFFCSELVATVFQAAGIQIPSKCSNMFIPADFSSQTLTRGIWLSSEYSFSPDIHIDTTRVVATAEPGRLILSQPLNVNVNVKDNSSSSSSSSNANTIWNFSPGDVLTIEHRSHPSSSTIDGHSVGFSISAISGEFVQVSHIPYQLDANDNDNDNDGGSEETAGGVDINDTSSGWKVMLPPLLFKQLNVFSNLFRNGGDNTLPAVFGTTLPLPLPSNTVGDIEQDGGGGERGGGGQGKVKEEEEIRRQGVVMERVLSPLRKELSPILLHNNKITLRCLSSCSGGGGGSITIQPMASMSSSPILTAHPTTTTTAAAAHSSTGHKQTAHVEEVWQKMLASVSPYRRHIHTATRNDIIDNTLPSDGISSGISYGVELIPFREADVVPASISNKSQSKTTEPHDNSNTNAITTNHVYVLMNGKLKEENCRNDSNHIIGKDLKPVHSNPFGLRDSDSSRNFNNINGIDNGIVHVLNKDALVGSSKATNWRALTDGHILKINSSVSVAHGIALSPFLWHEMCSALAQYEKESSNSHSISSILQCPRSLPSPVSSYECSTDLLLEAMATAGASAADVSTTSHMCNTIITHRNDLQSVVKKDSVSLADILLVERFAANGLSKPPSSSNYYIGSSRGGDGDGSVSGSSLLLSKAAADNFNVNSGRSVTRGVTYTGTTKEESVSAPSPSPNVLQSSLLLMPIAIAPMMGTRFAMKSLTHCRSSSRWKVLVVTSMLGVCTTAATVTHLGMEIFS
eukprot:gene1146-2213_t